jgi:membrane fusion protein, adhesin transport system
MSKREEKRKVSNDLQRLDRSVLLQEAGAPTFTRYMVGASVLLVLFFIVWACFIEVDEVAKAKGEMVSSLPVHPVQHLYGGTVQRVLVREGQEVKRDEVLVRLHEEELTSQLSETKVQWELARAKRIRIEHFLEGKNDLSGEPLVKKFDAYQEAHLRQNLKTLKSTRNVVFQQIVQLKRELEEDREKLSSTEGLLRISKQELERHMEFGMVSVTLLNKEKLSLEEELEIREDLVDQGLNSEIKFLGLKRQHLQLKKDIHEKETASEDRLALLQKQVQQFVSQVKTLPFTIQRKEANILELKGDLEQKESELLESSMSERDKAFEVEKVSWERLRRLEDRISRSELRAPIAGSVHSLRSLGPNAVLTPGEVFCSIVPRGARLLAEIRIDNRDVGHLELGQPARIKMTSFDFSRYGSLPGKLTLISANKSMDEQSQPYFLAHAEVLSYRPAPDKMEMPLRVGMSLDADIITGKKTVMEYLLKPIYASTLGALQER